jgi:predicted TIM-barrel fold metal-dependent hydrolase
VYLQDHEGVRYMLVSSASTSTIGRGCGMAEMLAMVARYGERLGAMLWANPHDPAWAEDVPVAAAHGFRGLKIHPVLDHYAVTPEALDGVFACARAQGWPILTHADVDGSPMAAAPYEPLLRAYPDVPLILAHLRPGAIPLARRYENVYLDTTYVDAWMVEVGLAALGAGKLLFGSDACEGFDVGRVPGRVRPRRSYAGLIAALHERGITDADLERICYTNTKELFGLDGV